MCIGEVHNKNNPYKKEYIKKNKKKTSWNKLDLEQQVEDPLVSRQCQVYDNSYDFKYGFKFADQRIGT